jgi:hypothetical protein
MVQQVAEEIVRAFRDGTVPKALAQVFIHFRIDCPAQKWSFRNRFIAALHGHPDARGFRQWQEIGRQVRKGERAFRILAPCVCKAKEDDPDNGISEGDPVLRGFRPVAVFGYGQTEGDPIPEYEEADEFLEALPLIEVAHTWDIQVLTFTAGASGKLGFFSESSNRIGVGVYNASTWCHELIHAADARRGSISPRPGQQLDNEVVAELGGAVLLECLGQTVDSDRGGAFQYIERYAEKHKRTVLDVCSELLDRTCACVALILETAEELAAESLRPCGLAAGELTVPDDFDEPLPEDVLALFERTAAEETT